MLFSAGQQTGKQDWGIDGGVWCSGRQGAKETSCFLCATCLLLAGAALCLSVCALSPGCCDLSVGILLYRTNLKSLDIKTWLVFWRRKAVSKKVKQTAEMC